jgi:hypothetical protein
MKAISEHDGVSYLMTPEQATEVIALILKHGTERWVSGYDKDPDTNKYLTTYTVEPAPSPFADIRAVALKLVPDEAYGVAKMRYQAKEKS